MDRFGDRHPDLDIELTIVDREAWKTRVGNVLQADPPDVANWWAGNRLLPHVEAGPFRDISTRWEESVLTKSLASTLSSITVGQAGSRHGARTAPGSWRRPPRAHPNGHGAARR